MLRKLFTFAILLSFIGQALAVTISSCSMHQNAYTEQQSSDMVMMDHSHHAINSVDSTSASEPNCCDDELSCDMSGCAILAISDNVNVYSSILLNQKINFHSALSLSSPFISLFRPPILS